MPKFNISVILLINQSKELVISIFSVLCLKGSQNSPLMHVPLRIVYYFLHKGMEYTECIVAFSFFLLMHSQVTPIVDATHLPRNKILKVLNDW